MDKLCDPIIRARENGDWTLWPCRHCANEYSCDIQLKLLCEVLNKHYPFPWTMSWDRKSYLVCDAKNSILLKTVPQLDTWDSGDGKTQRIGSAYKLSAAIVAFINILVNRYARNGGTNYVLTEFHYEQSEGETVKTYTGSFSALVAKMGERFEEVKAKTVNGFGDVLSWTRAYFNDNNGTWRYEWWLKESEEVHG